MNAEKHKAALTALNELILSELQSEDRQRFASVKRLSVLAQRLLLENNPSAEDADPGDGDDYIGEDFGAIGIPRRRLRHGIIGPAADGQQQLREMLAMLGPALGGLQNHNVARRKESVARELNELLQASQELHGAAREEVQKRIDAIIAGMNKELCLSG